MATWFYQLDASSWSPERFRLEIWEGERWSWPVRKVQRRDQDPKPGDTVAFFYAPSGGPDPGFYGWAVITEWYESEQDRDIYFRATPPTDFLKMNPWWDQTAKQLAGRIRGGMKQGTFWFVDHHEAIELRNGITAWITGKSTNEAEPE